MLEALDWKDNNMECIAIEQAQAWILLAIYELMRTTYRRGWMSAGRSFRLVQLMRLYEIDGPNNPTEQRSATTQADWVETEERRRTFWMAYTLDRYVSICNEWPLTLNEQVVSVVLCIIVEVMCAANLCHSDLYSSSRPRTGIPERQTSPDGLFVRSDCCQQPYDAFSLHRMCYSGHDLRAQYIPSTTIHGRRRLWKGVSGLLGSTPVAQHNFDTKNTDSVATLSSCIRACRFNAIIHQHGGANNGATAL